MKTDELLIEAVRESHTFIVLRKRGTKDQFLTGTRRSANKVVPAYSNILMDANKYPPTDRDIVDRWIDMYPELEAVRCIQIFLVTD